MAECSVTVKTWTTSCGQTGGSCNSHTNDAVFMSFWVHNAWTTEEIVFTSSSRGSMNTVSTVLRGVPVKIRLRIDGADGWNFWKLRATLCGEEEIRVGSDGNSYSSTSWEHWLDGDGSSAASSSASLEWYLCPANSVSPAGLFGLFC